MHRNRASHLVELLHWRAQQDAGRTAFVFRSGEGLDTVWSYEALDQRARAVAVAVLELAVAGDRALLLTPAGGDFVSAILGCFYSGIVAVPAYPPANARQIPRIEALVRDARTNLIVTNSKTRERIQRWLAADGKVGQFRFLCVDEVPLEMARQWAMPALDSGTLAFLQYTSGSTSEPKGVMVGHGNLVANAGMIATMMEAAEETVVVSWLPMFHDMGLVGNLLTPLYIGGRSVVMAPQAFVQEPVRWLQLATEQRATNIGAPNFGYALCVDNVSEAQCEGLDLSSVKVAYCGSEPIDPRVLDRFAAAYSPHGLRKETLYPCYGMAEATLLVAGNAAGGGARSVAVDARSLGAGLAVPSDAEGAERRVLVGCGRTPEDQELRIVDPETRRPLPEGRVGEVWVRGPHVAQGYWGKEELTEETFHARLADTGEGPFLRTGDLAFLDDGDLFVTGRLKDVMIIRGRNSYPQDIERTAEACHPAIQPSAAAVFSIHADGAEEVVVVAEVRRSALRGLDREQVVSAIRSAVFAEHELAVHSVVLLKPLTLPKTSSGKVRRSACRDAFLEGTLEELQSTSRVSEVMEETSSSGSSVPRSSSGSTSQAPRSAEEPRGTSADGDRAGSRARADRIIEWLRDYGEHRIDSRLMDERRMIPPYIVLDFGNHGLLGLMAPQELGGMGLTYRDTFRVFEQLAAIDVMLGTFVGLQNALGIRPLLMWASPEQLQLVPPIAQGRELASFAYTEPAAGSNPGAIEATATPDGKGGWTLRGSKKWIGTAAWASWVHVFAHVLDERGRHRGITTFTVRQGTPGFIQGPEELTMGMRGMIQNTIYLNDVPVGPGDVLGGLGRGRDIAQDIMEFGRTVISACGVGLMKRCMQLMTRYARNRTVSTGRLLDNLVTRERLGQIAIETMALETLVQAFADWADAKVAVPRECYPAIKALSAETAWTAVDEAVQLLGGRGYIETNIVPQMMRDARVMRVFEGPSETMQMFVGNRLAGGSAPFLAFLHEHVGAPALADDIEQLAAALKLRADQASSGEVWQDGQRIAMLMGAIGMWGLWLGVVESAARQRPELAPAADWLRQRYATVLAEAREATPERDRERLMKSEDLERIVAGYAGQIGDVEQHRPSVLDDLDPLLRRGGIGAPEAAIAPKASPRLHVRAVAPVLAPAGAGERQAVEQWLQQWVAKRLNLDLAAVGVTKPFADLGLDSLTAVELAHELEKSFGVTVAPTATWDFPNIEALAESVATEAPLVAAAAPVSAAKDTPAAAPDALDALSAEEMAALLAGELRSTTPINL